MGFFGRFPKIPGGSCGANGILRTILLFIAAVCLASICAGLLGYFDLTRYAASPPTGRSFEKTVIVSKGQSLKKITDTLHAEGLISHPFKFRLLARLKGVEKSIQAGEYLLSSDLSPAAILERMVSGKVRLYRFTIPEGSNLKQIAEIIEAAGLEQRQAFLRSARDAGLAEKMGIEAATFEGYLYPETYFFPKDTSAEQIIETMVARLRSEIPPDWIDRSAELGFSLHETITLASIIEKETGAPFERPLISSVFHNRMKKGMRLETDPTVIYGIKNFNGNLTRKDLETSTPYNTYRIQGLPPGPIASPGRAAIEAALYPADTKFLYFVSKRDGTHQFSTNLIDHNRAIRKYQLRK